MISSQYIKIFVGQLIFIYLIFYIYFNAKNGYLQVATMEFSNLAGYTHVPCLYNTYLTKDNDGRPIQSNNPFCYCMVPQIPNISFLILGAK